MKRSRLIYPLAAAAAGVVVGFGAIFLGGAIASENSPATDVDNFNADNGFVQGSVEYGTRGGAGSEQ